MPQYKRYREELKGKALQDLWTDINRSTPWAASASATRRRSPRGCLSASSRPPRTRATSCLDCFSGSGTAAVVAQRLGRRWIAIDCGKFAVYITQRRLLARSGKSAKTLEPELRPLHRGPLRQRPGRGHVVRRLRGLLPGAVQLPRGAARHRRHPDGGHAQGRARPLLPVQGHRRRDGPRLHRVAARTPEGQGHRRGLRRRARDRLRPRAVRGRHRHRQDHVLHPARPVLGHRGAARPAVQAARPAVTPSRCSTTRWTRSASTSCSCPEVEVTLREDGERRSTAAVDSFMRGGLDPDDFPELEDAGRLDLAMVLVDRDYDGDVFRVSDHFFGDELEGIGWTFSLPLQSAASGCWSSTWTRTATSSARPSSPRRSRGRARRAKAASRRETGEMTPKAKLSVDQFAVDDLVLPVSQSYDPAKLDLAAYEDFIDAVVAGREYSKEAILTALRLMAGGRYADTGSSPRRLSRPRRRWSAATERVGRLLERLPFPDKLACTLDLATGTGKSYVMFCLARIMLNEGLVNRVLVLCPSLTIEAGLNDKFDALLADTDLTALLPDGQRDAAARARRRDHDRQGRANLHREHPRRLRDDRLLHRRQLRGLRRDDARALRRVPPHLLARRREAAQVAGVHRQPGLRLPLPRRAVGHLLRRQRVLRRRRPPLQHPRRHQRPLGQGRLLRRQGRDERPTTRASRSCSSSTRPTARPTSRSSR